MRKDRYLRNVVTLKLDTLKCTGCVQCTKVCPHAVFKIKERKAVIIDRDACMECGACAKNCPAQAIEVRTGVGCATAIIMGGVNGPEPACCCSGETKQACC